MWNLIPILALPLVRGIATFPNVEICIGPHGKQISCSDLELELDETNESGEWNCDIRAWTRAPDFIPGHSIPAETRLSLNGSACTDIVGWEVGLRMKERAIIKIRNYEVGFPEKPKRKPFNHTAIEIQMPDMNDIYTGRYGGYYGHRNDDEEYEAKLEVYNEAIRNKSLFQVDGKERVLFDDKLTMELPVFDGEKPVNHIRGFSVDVPLTNFPPMKAYEGNMASSGKDEQMLNTETMFEYYHLLTLSNGTVLDIPAGRAGFLTEPQPTSLDREKEMEWPAVVVMDSPKKLNETVNEGDDEYYRRKYEQGPDCDAGNKAGFELKVSSDAKDIMPDRNITLTIHLTRTGNGTEYPAYLDVSLTTYQNQTFAYTYPSITSTEAYNNLLRDEDYHRYGRIDMSYPQKMLLVKSQESLERRRKDEENNYGMVSVSGDGGRWPVSRGSVRYDFEEIYGEVGDKEEYEFEVEFPIPYNAYPNFVTVFSTLTPQLSFSLQTTFLCSKSKPTADEKVPDEDEILDERWAEWRLPSKRRSGDPYGAALTHRGYVPIVIHRESNLGQEQADEMKHYLDPSALAPALSTSIISKIIPLASVSDFKTVGQELRTEEVSELKQSRYDLWSSGRQYRPRCTHRNREESVCWRRSNGGGDSHAAKLWQRMEEESKSAVVEEKTPKLKEGQTVYQVPGSNHQS